ncbi:3-dehydroquinate synthase [Aridibaculum aurantiacum]|uniref:3-dehydroquinate synthase n=1 Tax=Aridibaculum aurantiacum TaxID=2810307 RepID=UPI001A95F932|nr:3-dehydroquinate synthase [Aridibaculum aurantiacum]
MKKTIQFSSATVHFYFDTAFAELEKLVPKEQTIILTDENVHGKHKKKFAQWKVIILPAGEAHKNQSTVDNVIEQMIALGADRKTTLVGVGGGVITDITGYVAGIFMRGISFGFVPTSILAMVDAAIGGKNGVDVGMYKNMVGLIRQPSFLLYDYSLLATLPTEEWINGFAEIIKHSCIKDRKMFVELQQQKIRTFQKDPAALAKLIRHNADIKIKVVQQDEFEQGERKLLNFGHTIGHAIENLYQIPHGHAISIGMGVACKVSSAVNGFKETAEVLQLLKQYGLPPQFDFDKEATYKILQADKKKQGQQVNYILLQKIGKAIVHPIGFDELAAIIDR